MPRLRRFDPVWFRLRTPVPFDVVFPSVTYRLRIEQQKYGSWNWALLADGIGQASLVHVSEDFAEEAWLREALYETGFSTRHITLGETIMARTV